MTDVTTIIAEIEAGDQAAASKLLPLVYDELRKLARLRLAKETPGASVQPTLLVHDAYLRLIDGDRHKKWNGKNHFFGAAAEAMRRIIIVHARRKQAEKHGGRMKRIGFDFLPPDDVEDRTDLLDLNEVLTELEKMWPDKAALVKLRSFVGMSVQEAADSLGISLSSAERSWKFSRAWLHSRMSRE